MVLFSVYFTKIIVLTWNKKFTNASARSQLFRLQSVASVFLANRFQVFRVFPVSKESFVTNVLDGSTRKNSVVRFKVPSVCYCWRWRASYMIKATPSYSLDGNNRINWKRLKFSLLYLVQTCLKLIFFLLNFSLKQTMRYVYPC